MDAEASADAKPTGSKAEPSGEAAQKEGEVFGPPMWGATPELVRKDRGAGDLRVAKLTKTGKSKSRRMGAGSNAGPLSFVHGSTGPTAALRETGQLTMIIVLMPSKRWPNSPQWTL